MSTSTIPLPYPQSPTLRLCKALVTKTKELLNNIMNILGSNIFILYLINARANSFDTVHKCFQFVGKFLYPEQDEQQKRNH